MTSTVVPTAVDLAQRKEQFVRLTENIGQWIQDAQPQQVVDAVDQYCRSQGDPGRQSLLRGVEHTLRGNWLDALAAFRQAAQYLHESDYPVPDSLYTQALVRVQLSLPAGQRPATKMADRFFQANLQALRETDPDLADLVADAPWPPDVVVLEYWPGLHFFSLTHKHLLLLDDDVRRQLEPATEKRQAIMFGGVCTGQELAYCLRHQCLGLHGMSRAHYLYEPEPARLRGLMHLYDLTDALASRKLVLFGGSDYQKKSEQFFSSLRYPPPGTVVGHGALVQDHAQFARDCAQLTTHRDPAEQYYQSVEFRQRLESIAAGHTKPRILITTCRFTTFLRYCASDFQRAFERLGCSTRYQIEEDDVQCLMPTTFWRDLDSFRPDAVFSVSHARPSHPYLPRELPFIAYIQDQCEPLTSIFDLTGRIQPHDLFPCYARGHRQFLLDRNVPEHQTFLLPVPVDETMFYPLPPDHPLADKFTVDVGFTKHGTPDADTALKLFLLQVADVIKEDALREHTLGVFRNLYRKTALDPDHFHGEEEMANFVLARFQGDMPDPFRNFLRATVTNYLALVYAPAWRYRFLYALDDAGLDFALYGKDWHQNPRLAPRSHGLVDRETELNAVYNFNRINLSINQSLTMTVRLVEAGLAGGFVLAADHPRDNDYLPARDYFEADKEVVFFDTPADCVEKCRHYLEHENERRTIAHNLRERCLRERTTRAGAELTLHDWRQLLQKTLQAR